MTFHPASLTAEIDRGATAASGSAGRQYSLAFQLPSEKEHRRTPDR
jgi:hypothetical protein